MACGGLQQPQHLVSPGCAAEVFGPGVDDASTDGGGTDTGGADADAGAEASMPDAGSDGPVCAADAAPSARNLDPAIRDFLSGTNGAYVDSCDGLGDLTDYSGG